GRVRTKAIGPAISRCACTLERQVFGASDCCAAGDRHPRKHRRWSSEGHRQEHPHGCGRREHLRYVMQQPCLVCGRKPSDPHHLRYMQPRALGRKASDEFAVPLCRGHHRELHRARDERAWWKQAGIDPIKVARRLWKETMGERRSRREAVPRPNGAPVSSDPKNDEISATATTQDETRRGEMLENRGDV